jgi:hypothetical protein
MPKSKKSAAGLATALLTFAVEAFKAAGDLKSARRVEAILKGRPKLSEAEAEAYREAVDRLARDTLKTRRQRGG